MNDQDLVNLGTEHSSGERVEFPRPAQSEGLAGRELDAAIAEHVMGWQAITGYHSSAFGNSTVFCLWEYPGNLAIYRNGRTKGAAERWSPSTDIAAAMEVLLTMRERNYGWSIGTHKHGWYVRCFELPDAELNPRRSIVVDMRLTAAICRAALAAVAHNAPERDAEITTVG